MFSVLKQILPFKPALPTPAYLTRKALKACRRAITIQQGWGVQLRDLRASEIPEELSFDRIVFPQPGKEVCSPANRDDFMNFLLNETHTHEYLKFLLFHHNYTELYNTLAAEGAAGLSPQWTKQDEEDAKKAVMEVKSASKAMIIPVILPTPPSTADSNFNTNFGAFIASASVSSPSPPSTAGSDYPHLTDISYPSSTAPMATNPRLSDEIEKTLATFIRRDSPQELNISDTDRCILLHSLQRSNHPAALNIIVKQVDDLLRSTSHPEFVNFVVKNGKAPRMEVVGVVLRKGWNGMKQGVKRG